MRRELLCPLCRRQVGLGSCTRICLHPKQHCETLCDAADAAQAIEEDNLGGFEELGTLDGDGRVLISLRDSEVGVRDLMSLSSRDSEEDTMGSTPSRGRSAEEDTMGLTPSRGTFAEEHL